MAAKQEKSSKKLKFSEWRPIGVCDTAVPGEQKAQMFTREDFLLITARGVNRDNWRKNPEVTKVLNRYIKKLEKISTLTQGMKQPTSSKITLVGAIMKLGVTPTLNRESKDGKLQFFQIKFEEKGKKRKRKTSWLLISSLFLGALILVIGAFIILNKFETKRYRAKRIKVRTFEVPFCQDSMNTNLYTSQLEEVGWIMQSKVNDIFYQENLTEKPDCIEKLLSISALEQRFLECFVFLKQKNAISSMARSDLKKVEGCQKQICSKQNSKQSPDCL